MPERPVPLSPAALQLAGHVGQTALDRISAGGVALVAQLDQHVAAVRAELAACQERPVITAEQADEPASDEPGSCPCSGTRLRPGGRRGRRARIGLRGDRARLRGRRDESPGRESGSAGATTAGVPVSGDATCPDVPFAATALHTETTVPVELLLHYASGFVQAGLSDGWVPAASADADDWVSLRLAAICQLIRQAEAAAKVHPDLRATP